MEADQEEGPRITYTVNVRPETKLVLETFKKLTGMPITQAVARILDWVASQPDEVRRAILFNSHPEEEIWRRRHAEKLSRGEGTMGIKDIPAAAQQLRELADRIEIFDRARTRPAKRKE